VLECGIRQPIMSAGSRLGCQIATIPQRLWRVRWHKDWAKSTNPCLTGLMLVLMGGNEKPTFNRIWALPLRFYDFFDIPKVLDQ
jgi:hypothetical protein